MKKLLVVILALLLLVSLLAAALPVMAEGPGSGPPSGPPGWSHENPGQGGTDNPGPGGLSTVDPSKWYKESGTVPPRWCQTFGRFDEQVGCGTEKADQGGQGDHMTEQRLVVLFGDSLFMDTVEARLENSQELGVVRIHCTVTDVVGRLKSLGPDFVILDTSAHESQFALLFLQEQPGVPLLCLDVTCSKVVTLSSKKHTIRTTDELVQLIREQVFGGNGDNGSLVH